jgi:hypothetical protein
MTARLRAATGLLLVGLLLLAPARAQQSEPSPSEGPTHNLALFESIDLPDPNAYRAAAGRPGPEYWQQRADYDIEVRLDPTTHRVTGTETITYTNNAPQVLQQLWVQLDQNLFKPDSRGARITPPDARFSGAFEGGGYTIARVTITRDGETLTPEYVIDDTRMRIALDEPLAARGGTLELNVEFSFTVPEYGADRMGRLDVEQGMVYELAQWYPRMYVFDDVHGWNPLPYLGQGEYYTEFGDFEVDITVPRAFIVAATGTLLNPNEVLTNTQQERMVRARTSDAPVMIIDSTEVGEPGTRPEGSGPLTWRYQADDVRDFAWATSQAFIWDAARADGNGDDVLAMSLYPHEGIGSAQNPGWEESTRYIQHSIAHYSDKWEAYPYPVAINVAGVVGGMEYPQIVFCSVNARGRGLFGVTDHEFGHEWFPMLVGSDERRHAWMDEGLTTFLNFYSGLDFYDGTLQAGMQRYAQLVARTMQSPVADQPIFTYADRIRPQGLGFLAYRKPAAGLVLLREYILGPERFDPAFQAYIDRWAYKHPKPADFFRTVEDVAGENLDWFWRGWFYSTATLDQTVANVQSGSASEPTRITISHQNDLMLPVEMQITFADGSTEQRRIPVEAFFTSDTFNVTVEQGRTVQEVQIDPRSILPDVDRGNNTWQRDEAASSSNSGSSR